MLTTLRIAIHDARVRRDTDGLVRLVVQNLPRFPEVPSLRMELVPTLLEQGDVDDATLVIQRSAELELAAGRVGAAIARFRDAEALEIDTGDWWDALFDELDRRGPSGAPSPARRTPAALDTDRPPLSGDALLGVAIELATRVPDEPWHAERFEPLAGLETLDAPARRDVLSALERVSFAAGDTVSGDAVQGPTWWLDGVLECDGAVFEPRCGALVDVSPAPLVARTDGAFLGLADHRRDELRARYELDARVAATRRTWATREAVTSTRVWAALGPARRDRLRAALVGYRLDDTTVVEAGEPWPMLGVVVEGRLEMIDRAGSVVVRVGRIGPGEWFGESIVADNGRARWQVRTSEPTAVVGVSADTVGTIFEDQDAARAALDALFAERADAVHVLDTGEVELVNEATE